MSAEAPSSLPSRIGPFLLATFLPSWALVATFVLLAKSANRPAPVLLVSALFSVFPGVAAAGTAKLLRGEKARDALALDLRPNATWLFAIALAAGATSLSLAIGLLWPGQSYAPDFTGYFERLAGTIPAETLATMRAEIRPNSLWVALGKATLSGVTINTLLAAATEAGFRGYLQRELGGATVRTSVVTGVLAAVWRLPLVVLMWMAQPDPATRNLGILLATAVTLVEAPILVALRARAESIVAPALFHGVLVAYATLPGFVTRGGSDLTIGAFGVPGVIALVLLAAALWAPRLQQRV